MGATVRELTSKEGQRQEQTKEPETSSALSKLRTVYINILSYLFFIAVSVNFLEIIIRVVFNSSIDLFFDVPTWLNSWVMLLVSGIVLLDNQHLSIDAIREKMRNNIAVSKILDLCNNLLTLGFGLVLTYAGIVYVKQLYTFNSVVSRSINVPSWLIESCVPLGMGFFTICAVIKLIKDLRK